jgi:hypothetical protein
LRLDSSEALKRLRLKRELCHQALLVASQRFIGPLCWFLPAIEGRPNAQTMVNSSTDFRRRLIRPEVSQFISVAFVALSETSIVDDPDSEAHLMNSLKSSSG